MILFLTSTDQNYQILQKNLPETVANIVLGAPGIEYEHRIFILNVSCGESILNK